MTEPSCFFVSDLLLWIHPPHSLNHKVPALSFSDKRFMSSKLPPIFSLSLWTPALPGEQDFLISVSWNSSSPSMVCNPSLVVLTQNVPLLSSKKWPHYIINQVWGNLWDYLRNVNFPKNFSKRFANPCLPGETNVRSGFTGTHPHCTPEKSSYNTWI